MRDGDERDEACNADSKFYDCILYYNRKTNDIDLDNCISYRVREKLKKTSCRGIAYVNQSFYLIASESYIHYVNKDTMNVSYFNFSL